MKLSEVSVGQKLYLVHSSRGEYRTYDVYVTKVNTSSIYVKKPGSDYERRFIKKGKFPLRDNNPLVGWLGSTYLTDIPNQAVIWKKRDEQNKKLDDELESYMMKISSIGDLNEKESVIKSVAALVTTK
ncbi:hypothetical protein JK163_11250 [Levilactobacillus brevis]|uniref:beta barrel domain-containing protein n=1 Tax=Levilactobacillus brevis TaxID=1580 RepID=UPI001BACBD31|nr:hypothetical protein [Levilactobacillus brevis]MBS1006844.1 hypothetical protein [Levilactobacillus brevis]